MSGRLIVVSFLITTSSRNLRVDSFNTVGDETDLVVVHLDSDFSMMVYLSNLSDSWPCIFYHLMVSEI